MKSDSASFSALAPAAVRAIESYRNKEERLFDDRFAIDLLPLVWRVIIKLMRIPSLRNLVLELRERQFPGIIGNLLCRTRFIDDVLLDALNRGIEQLVILGAGFDSRAYRIPGIERILVFEVDHPSPQAQKKARLQKIFGMLPSHVVFVPIDFNRQKLGDALAAANFRTGVKTFFIWEGVTQYITEESVDATFRYVSHAAAAGSAIVFTYIKREIIDGTARSELDQKVVSVAQRFGCPWIFGLNQAELARYLTERGLTLGEDVGALEYKVLYLDPVGRQLKIFEGERVALAHIF